jgi:DNA transformation protein and related proteins
MKNLINQPNLGKELVKQLTQIGITSIEELVNMGSENAFIKIKTIDESACINRLYALEGAVQGIRWHSLSKQRKAELLEFFKLLKL